MGYTLPELLKVQFPERRTLLSRNGSPVFKAGHVGEVYGSRGFGKTWFLQTLALVASCGGKALGFDAPEPCRVLYLDGEMGSEEIQERFAFLCRVLGATTGELLTVIGADWQDQALSRLDTADQQSLVAPNIEGADMVILDNRSCLFDPEGEKDPSAWQPAQTWLLSLRRAGKGVLLGHHSNRQGGARGHSKPEDAMNMLIKLSRPEDYSQDQGARFLVEWEKSRGIHGGAVAPFVAALGDSGWSVERADRGGAAAVEAKIREYLATAASLGESPNTATKAAQGAGVNKSEGLKCLKRLMDAGEAMKTQDGLRLA